MGKLIREIAQWHKETFEGATFNGQQEKFLAELIEFYEEDDEEKALFELADCFIVACGLWRFNRLEALSAFINVETIAHLRGISRDSLIEAVNKKMEINRSRTWQNNGEGSYQHK